MRICLAFLLVFAVMKSSPAAADVFKKCGAELIDAERLICYDAAAKAAEALKTSETPATVALSSDTVKSNARSQTGGEDVSNTPKSNLWPLEKLTSDDPNFFGISIPPDSNNPEAASHAEFDISLKYPILTFGDTSRIYFIYNGSYDFHVFSNKDIYDSDPVISTSQNPGLAYEWDVGNGSKKYRIGAFHHSNGQTLNESHVEGEPNSANANAGNTSQAAAEFKEISDRWGEAAALERVSRSSWYTQFRYQSMSNAAGFIADDWWQYQLEIRPWYFKNDDEIFWAPIPSKQPRLEDFDGLRAVGERMFSLDEIPILRHSDAWRKQASKIPIRFLGRAELQTGLWSPFENVGGQVSLGVNVNNLIFSLYYYSGYAKDISAYHKRTKHFGFGFELR
ncbi:MAG: phospholipase A [Pseudomonadales bacterium]|nr:phospholipase A [Pseudomonadales bacterium]MDG1442801.1 phospholipase A [Pseudomonadales bacterium]